MTTLLRHIIALFLTGYFLIPGNFAQNCDFSELHISDCQWQASRSSDSSPALQWQVFDEATLSDADQLDDDQASKTPSSLLTKYALLRFGILFNATRGKATLLSTSVSPFLRCLTFWYRANASPFIGQPPSDAPSPGGDNQTPTWPTFRLKLIGGNDGLGVESDTTLLYTLPLQPGAIDGDRWQFRELSVPNVKTHYRILLEVEIPKRVIAGYVAIDNIAFQARCDAGLHSSYSMWPGNCRGNFIMDWGEPAGCRRCSLEECAVMCDSFSNCDGFSYATSGGATLADMPQNYQCYLKQGGCSQLVAELPYSYFAKSGRHGASTPKPARDTTPAGQSILGGGGSNRRGDGDDGGVMVDIEETERRGQLVWSQWTQPAPPTTKRLRWQTTTTTPPSTTSINRRPPARIISLPPGPLASGGALIIPAVFDDRYEQLDGNCGGNFLFRNGLRVGCQGCSLEECKQLCSKFELATDASREGLSISSREQFGSRCLGFSYTGRADVEPRCLLKSMNYCVPSYNTLGYFFYRKLIESRHQHKEEGATITNIPTPADLSNTTTSAIDAV